MAQGDAYSRRACTRVAAHVERRVVRTRSALPSLVRTGEVSTSDGGEARFAPEFPAASALSVRALVKAASEPGFELREVPRPSIRDNEVLIRVRRAGVCGTDVHLYDWDAWAQGRCHPPFTVGHEFAGDVVQVGHLVTDVREGDRVTAEGHIVCGRCHLCRTGNAHVCPNTCIIGVDRDGCFADYIAMPATNVWPLDEAISYEIGGIHDPMGNAFHTALTNTEVPGSTVLVTGCGPIGIFAVGICRAAGASRIIASDVNPTRLALARAMGAHDAVTPQEAEAAVRAATGSLGMDVVLEMSGVPSAIHQAFALVRDGDHLQGADGVRRGGPPDVRDLDPDDAVPPVGRVRPDTGDHPSLPPGAI